MTEAQMAGKPTAKDVWRIAWPMIIAYASVPLMGVMSVAVMGHLEDPRYLGGVGLATNFFAFFYFIFAFIRWSTTGLAAQATGRAAIGGGDDELCAILLRSLSLGLLLGLLLALLREPLTRLCFDLLTSSAMLQDEATRYAAWRFLGAPALLGTYALNGWFIGSARPKAVLTMTLLANTANVLLLLVAVHGFGARSAGAGAAAALAEWIGFATGVLLALRTGKVRFRGNDLHRLLNRADLRALFSANLNVLIKTLFTITIFFAFLGISGRFDAATLAANLVLLQMFYLCSYVMDGVANACEALAGRAEGAGQPALIDAILRLCLRCALGVGLLFALIYGALGHLLVALMSSIPDVVATATNYRAWIAVAPLLMAGAFVFDGVFVGTLRLRELRNSAIIATLGFALVCANSLPLLGNHGLWLSFVAYFAIRQGAAFVLYRRSQARRLAIA